MGGFFLVVWGPAGLHKRLRDRIVHELAVGLDLQVVRGELKCLREALLGELEVLQAVVALLGVVLRLLVTEEVAEAD